MPLGERLVVLEAPTGTGKTEASVMWAQLSLPEEKIE